jgi:dTDP-glucose 4,6-dehydratase
MHKILITGGAGFIGANFVHHWVERQPSDRVVVVDALTYAGNLENIQKLLDNGRVRFVHADILDTALMKSLLAEEDIDIIAHFAAESHVDRSIKGPEEFIRSNVQGTHSLLMAAREAWEGKNAGRVFHHVSTDEVYGSLGPDDPQFTETTPYSPNSPYAASKAASDHLVHAYHHTFGLPTVITNCSNNYGPYQFPEKFIPLMIINALQGKPLPIYGDGMNVRDWLYVNDHCAGIEAAILQGERGQCYNLGGECERKNIDVVKHISKVLTEMFAADARLRERFPQAPTGSFDSLLTYVPDRPGHDRRYGVDITKAARELKYRPTVDFEEGLRRTIRWYLDNEPWWRNVLSGSYRDWIKSHYTTLTH